MVARSTEKIVPFTAKVADDPYVVCYGQKLTAKGRKITIPGSEVVVMAYPPRKVVVSAYRRTVGRIMMQVRLPWLAVLSFIGTGDQAYIRAANRPVLDAKSLVGIFPFPHVFHYGKSDQPPNWYRQDQICGVYRNGRTASAPKRLYKPDQCVNKNLWLVNEFFTTSMSAFDVLGGWASFAPQGLERKDTVLEYLQHWSRLPTRKVEAFAFQDQLPLQVWMERVTKSERLQIDWVAK